MKAVHEIKTEIHDLLNANEDFAPYNKADILALLREKDNSLANLYAFLDSISYFPDLKFEVHYIGLYIDITVDIARQNIDYPSYEIWHRATINAGKSQGNLPNRLWEFVHYSIVEFLR